MKRSVILLCFVTVFCTFFVKAQQKKKSPANTQKSGTVKKYPSLLWEITGNGLTKPSYLFGTMHVSDKLVFHLGDSFYNAIKSAEVLALETNPETWQDDFSKSVFFKNAALGMDQTRMTDNYPLDNLSINTFALEPYSEFLKASLAVEPSMINGMLYRTYGTKLDDFEEDTFLDMYLFQVGKKLGKKVTGVENFQESEKLVMEAYKDMIRDQNKKRRSYDFEGMMNNPKKIEDAYRNGDLDVLDSLETLSVFSDAFQEKFLYKRNSIQANSIDSIIRKSSLFVGVGAAHLPGRRGVIEILRGKGYHLRPINMDERNSGQKEAIDKIRLPLTFKLQTAPDGFYKVAIPGEKFYRFTNWSGMDILQFADMVNGTYYMVNRIRTNSQFFGDKTETVLKKLDSMLYENIPGKILRKMPITKNGYKGIEVINRTRRGDYQRYNIFVTPFEVIIFKMSGNGEYVNIAEDALRFFNSIQIQEFPDVHWQLWQPTTGGFSVRMPHEPLVSREKSYGADRFEYAAMDKETGNNFIVLKTDLHNYLIFEEDSFDLNLLSESYASSSFVDTETSRSFIKVNGYPALECKYIHKDGSASKVRFVIQGANYYALIAKFKTEGKNVHDFLESFVITPFRYPYGLELKDSSMHFGVTSPPFKNEKEGDDESINKMQELIRLSYRGDEDEDASPFSSSGKSKFFGNDTIGEKIYVSFQPFSPYTFLKDSSEIWNAGDEMQMGDWLEDTSFIIRRKKEYTLADGSQCRELEITDTGSSRVLLSKAYYRNGILLRIATLTDTLSAKSSFIDGFFKSFHLVDTTMQANSFFLRRTDRFFSDFFSKDSLRLRSARRSVYEVEFDSTDAPLLMKGIDSLNWSQKNYLDIKKYWIAELGSIKGTTVVTYLKSLYFKVADTSDLQHAVLNALLSQKTKESFTAFKDLILQEPPITDEQPTTSTAYVTVRSSHLRGLDPSKSYPAHYGKWGELYDTLALTKLIFPDFLQLMNVEDYKEEVANLLTAMVDSGYLKGSDYENYFSKIYLDAKQQLKKQIAREEKIKIDKASSKDKTASYYNLYEEEDEADEGNRPLQQASVLLLPFWDKNAGVQQFFNQLMKTGNRKLLYETFLLLLRHQKPVPDSLFQKFAALDEYRSDLYSDLKKIKKEEKFPAAYKKQEWIARSLLVNSGQLYGKMDTLSFIDKLPVEYKNKKGFVYFFKYKRMKDDAAWQLASVGMQPADLTQVDVENDEFTEMEKRKLETDEPVGQQLANALKEMLNSKHPSAAGFYEGRAANMYRNFLPDMVKSNRYRD
jgi:uncharacterized protein YbaP (TraB family)